jgi:predicted PurR-regulated permease PerM
MWKKSLNKKNMKKQLIIVVIIVLLICVGLSGCYGPTTGIMIKKLNNHVGNFINMTEDQMKKFPHLKEAILTNKTVEVSSPSQEINEIQGILQYFDTDVIYYRNEYYEIHIFCAD